MKCDTLQPAISTVKKLLRVLQLKTRFGKVSSSTIGYVVCEIREADSQTKKQEAFEKCWAHSPLRAAARPFTRCRYCTPPLARRLRIDVHDNDDNDNA